MTGSAVAPAGLRGTEGTSIEPLPPVCSQEPLGFYLDDTVLAGLFPGAVSVDLNDAVTDAFPGAVSSYLNDVAVGCVVGPAAGRP